MQKNRFVASVNTSDVLHCSGLTGRNPAMDEIIKDRLIENLLGEVERLKLASKSHNRSRIAIMTFNMWTKYVCCFRISQLIACVNFSEGEPEHWPERKHTVLELLKHFEPDVLCVQEAHPKLQLAVQEALPNHDCITGSKEDGWQTEGESA
jgi:hypothetical protein